ncbi:MAG TPA: hypothetical protein DEO85_14070 [Maritimibacter sp.]|nr:hypothetical protein [Maritimibacter sp.]
MRRWSELTPDEQLRIREEYQRVLDREPRTCDMDEKVARFTEWLAERDIIFSADEISRKSR